MTTRRGGSVRRRGFALLYTLVLIALVGVAVMLLTGSAGTMAFESNRLYLEACSRNLVASGRVWAQANAARLPAQAKALNLDGLPGPAGNTLTVQAGKTDDGRPQVLISSSCSVGRHTIRGKTPYVVAAQ